MKKIEKLFNIEVKEVDEENRKITFCFSDDKEDRQGEIVDQASWDVKNYDKNPLILWGHNPEQPENVLGQGSDIKLNVGGKSYITAQFDEAEINPRADMVFRQLIKRTLRCVSAGFITHSYDMQEDVPVLRDNELLEISIVPIPANPRAIALAYKANEISEKDAKWMVKSMQEEIKAITSQINNKDLGEEDVEELKTQLTEALDGIKTLTETVTGLVTEVAAIKEATAEHVETDEEKTAREAREADDKIEADRIEAERLAKESESTTPVLEREAELEDELSDEDIAAAEVALEEALTA